MPGKHEVKVRIRSLLKWTGVGFGMAFLGLVIWFFWLWRFFAPPALNPPVTKPQFSRSDCMVRIDIVYPGDPSYDMIDEMAAAISSTFTRTLIDKHLPVASHGINSHNMNAHYTLFSQVCDRKVEMVVEMVAAYEKEYPDGAQLSISQSRIYPSIDTILARGDWWTDGHDPVPR